MPGYYPATSKWLDAQFTNWLYGTDEGKKFMYNFSGYPVIGDYMKAKDSERWINDYFQNRNLSWKDVKYPTMVKGSGAVSTTMHHLFSPTEKALKGLYANNERNNWRKTQIAMHRERMEAMDRRQRHYDAYLRAKYSGVYRY